MSAITVGNMERPRTLQTMLLKPRRLGELTRQALTALKFTRRSRPGLKPCMIRISIRSDHYGRPWKKLPTMRLKKVQNTADSEARFESTSMTETVTQLAFMT